MSESKVRWKKLNHKWRKKHSAVLGAGYGVTERKIAEEMINQKNLELEAGYSELESMNQEIRDSQEQLIKLNKQLQESQERLELALWGSNEGLWDWNFISGEMFLNDRIVKMLGYDPRTYVYHVDTWRNIMYPADKDYVWEKMKEHLQGKTACYEVEYRIITRTGDVMWVFDRGKAVERDAGGRVTRIVGMRMDITARKETEKAIIEARNQFSTLIAAIPELVVQFNLANEFVWVNDQAKEFYGQDVLGSKICNYFVNPDDYEEMVRGLECLKQSNQLTLNIETWQQRQNRDKRLLHWLVKPFYEDDKIIAYLATARDITKMHKAEEKIHYLSFHDSLTGLYNRAFATEEMQRLDTPKQLPLSIIMGDVNALKLSNDAFGHFEGDRLIKTIAFFLQQACRKEDIVARWGGDEFVIILPQTSYQEAYAICQRVRQRCQSAPADPIQPSIALGAASKERVEQNINEVLAEAEDSMYRNKLLEGKSLRNSIIAALEQSLNERTHETREHVQRMQDLSTIFARELGLTVTEIDRLMLLAKLHDIGKLGISDDILNKPAALNEEEWEAIKKHSEIGYRITMASHDLINIAEEVLSHHERWDGTGYPRGLSGEEIPCLARIISIVDSYDVMTHGRSYKEAMSCRQALCEIKNCAGTQFDPGLAESFLKVFDKKTDIEPKQ